MPHVEEQSLKKASILTRMEVPAGSYQVTVWMVGRCGLPWCCYDVAPNVVDWPLTRRA